MTRRFLIPVDGSECSMRAVEYVGDILCRGADCELTLFYVCTRAPGFQQIRREMEQESGLEPTGDENPENLRCYEACRQRVEGLILGPAEEILQRTCGRNKKISVNTKVGAGCETDVADQIIIEAKEGGYDTIVLGKWGTRMLTAFVWGEVTAKVIHRVQNCSVWVVDNSPKELTSDHGEESREEKVNHA